MPITITEYTEGMTEKVVQFNRRLAAGGVPARFPASHVPDWLPKIAGRRLYQEFFLALDEHAAVRGAYVLKHQDFRIGGQVLSVGDFRLPISEGVANRAYAQVGVSLLLDVQQRQPLLYALGMGGYDEPLPKLLGGAGWHMFSVPFFFRIVRPVGFLRNIVYLRRSAPKRWLLDGLAFTGLGWLAIKGFQALRYRPVPRKDSLAVETVDEFADWVDEIWEAARDEYGMCAVRDGATLRILYPKDQESFTRLKVIEGAKVIGWAVLLNTQLSGHKQFGDMRLGSIVDCFARPADAEKVIRAAGALLEKQRVDLIVSNQSHAAWCRGLCASGFARGPSNFIFAASGKLTQLLRESGTQDEGIHVNRGDGDGPINL